MIVTHTGPGIIPLPKADSPAQRNQVREQDLQAIAGALEDYKKDHGSLPIKLSSASTEVCTTIGADCKSVHKLDLGFLVNTGQAGYIQQIPRDPAGSNKEWSSGYFVAQLPDGTFRLNAPGAELGQLIQITR